MEPQSIGHKLSSLQARARLEIKWCMEKLRSQSSKVSARTRIKAMQHVESLWVTSICQTCSRTEHWSSIQKQLIVISLWVASRGLTSQLRSIHWRVNSRYADRHQTQSLEVLATETLSNSKYFHSLIKTDTWWYLAWWKKKKRRASMVLSCWRIRKETKETIFLQALTKERMMANSLRRRGLHLSLDQNQEAASQVTELSVANLASLSQSLDRATWSSSDKRIYGSSLNKKLFFRKDIFNLPPTSSVTWITTWLSTNSHS